MIGFERKLPSGISVIERATEPYCFITLTTASTEFTQESQEGGKPATPKTFQIDLSDLPVGHAMRAVYVDLEVGAIQNDHPTSLNFLERVSGEYDELFPWFVKKQTGVNWTRAGECTAADFIIGANTVHTATMLRRGHIDVKNEVNAQGTYLFRIGDDTGSEEWQSFVNNLYILAFRFIVRIEVI